MTTRNRSRGFGWTTLLSVLAVVGIAFVVAAFAGFRAVAIQTGSMRPTIAPGDVVVTRLEAATRLQPGAIVVFRHPALDRLVTHRVTRVNRTGDWVEVTTKGDANLATETWRVPASTQLGRAVCTV